MEKLQSALAKARQERSSAEGAAPSATTPATPRGDQPAAAPHPAGDLWQDLPAFEPDPMTLQRNRVLTLDARSEAAQFDILRTKVVLQMKRNNWTRLAITSPTASCGKTTTACNLAAGLSRQNDMKAIMFDLDLRLPNAGKLFGHRPTHDVTKMLSGEVGFAEQAVRLRDNVALSLARERSKDPTRVLLQQQTSRMLDEIEQTYKPNIMIFDLPPLLIGDDTRAFLTNVDCALIVAKADMTTSSQIDICEKEIAEHTNVLGLTLNCFRHASQMEEYSSY